MTNMFKTAIIGLGHPHIFSMIEELLAERDDFKICAICDPDTPENVEKAHEMVPDAKVCQSQDELYGAEEFDTVMSSAINGRKGEIALRALRSGKSIMLDKPLVTTKHELFAIEKALAENPRLRIALWLTCRYAPAYYTAKKLIDAGEIGKVTHLYFVRPHRLAPEKRPGWMFEPEMYGGIINDIGVHDLDLARWYTGSEYSEILAATASNKRFQNYNIEDNGCVFVKMGSGAEVMVNENWLTPDAFPAHGDTRALITGTKGFIEVLVYPEDTLKLVTDSRPPETVELMSYEHSSVKDFVLALKSGSHKPLVSTYDAIMATKFALEAQAIANK